MLKLIKTHFFLFMLTNVKKWNLTVSESVFEKKKNYESVFGFIYFNLFKYMFEYCNVCR